MDSVATIIQHLKSLYKTPSRLPSHPVLDNPWYIVAAVAFNAARQPESIISVYQSVLEDLKSNGYTSDEDHVTLVEKLREALLHASLTNGIPRDNLSRLRILKALTTVLLLNSVVPKSITERLSSPVRDRAVSIADLEVQGRHIVSQMYGVAEGNKLQSLIDSSFPDFAMFDTIAFGLVHGQNPALSMLEAAYALIAAGILNDHPREVSWYYLYAMRHGATIDEVKAVREMALKVASFTKFTLREEVPEVVPKESLPLY
ncbi:hypothetical protein ONZ45_g6322 [Pleurotus djamor]|nr:hypothetical protein ONZ45_g6322 [Pleurotus djamor]